MPFSFMIKSKIFLDKKKKKISKVDTINRSYFHIGKFLNTSFKVLVLMVLVCIGMDLWKRKQLHSHVYRVPDPFRDEVINLINKLDDIYRMMMVMMVGSGSSWVLSEWTRHINRACGGCKRSSFKCQIT